MSSDIADETSVPTSKWKECLKMALPHVGLYLFLFIYLLVGAKAFYWIEYEVDKRIQATKLNKIKEIYRSIASEIRDMSGDNNVWKLSEDNIFRQLSKLSSIHENRPFHLDPSLNSVDALPPRWSESSSFLYALSILTTTGYSNAVPVTPMGQSAAIIYGLIGIPLMVLAAVDIGRFLSHIVLTLYSKYSIIWKKYCVKEDPMKHVCGKKSTSSLRHRVSIRSHKSSRSRSEIVEDVVEENQAEKEKERTTKLPLSITGSILLVFCMLGGVTYIAAGGQATFIEAFFVTFNLVANLTMSEMPNDLNHVLTIIYIFVFVTFGVAVLSMCAELAASELKEIFLKIHYFGRKINFKRKQKKEQMEVEVKELLKIIEEIRRRYPDKEHITSLDILQYMHEATAMNALTERRDTIAFMPQTMEILRFADEQDMEERSCSRIEEAPLIDRTSRMVDVLQFSHDVDLENKFYHELRKYTREMNRQTVTATLILKIDGYTSGTRL
ncbi:unnamed protein product [Auanema sp. JU1783]|nr:unnamed protein product [Auanema sp. JU1783]